VKVWRPLVQQLLPVCCSVSLQARQTLLQRAGYK
jgi:hypothetical protein